MPNSIVEIAAFPRDNTVEVVISDNGLGLSEEVKAKLFKMESGMSLAGTAHENGTGLGLMICREFVEKHIGEIWAKSKPGSGRKFIFTLPIK